MKFPTILLALALGITSAQVLAQRQKTVVPELDDQSRKGEMARLAEERAEAKFNEADENKDDFISKEEAVKHLKYISENFPRYDKNNDGKLSWEEFVGHDRWKRKPPASK